MKNTKLWRGLTALSAVLLSVACFMTVLCNKWAGQINIVLGTLPPTVPVTGDTAYYGGDYTLDDDGYKKMVADSNASEIQTMTEGAVLVKNNNNALPLAPNERRVTLFGRSVADPVYRGNSGGPSADGSRIVSLKKALENENFVINQALYNEYESITNRTEGAVKRIKVPVENDDGIKSDIGEVPVSFYTESLKGSYASDYNDAAIVMFSRDGGEGRDLFTDDADNVSQLALHEDEADLLRMIKSSGKFSKTIVLINSAYAMELGWVEQDEYGVDACLWIGGPGLLGFEGVADILAGKADPSGRFVDTYAANSLSSAAVQNAGDISFNGQTYNYIVEAEGIYVGYKYYETRYQDQVLGINNADNAKGAFANTSRWNYSDEMAYPFGYGISYANFSQTLESVVWDKTAHTVTATVTVKNDGLPGGSNYSGKSKSVVQLYVQLPYEEGQAEKSAIQLIDFGKTKSLAAGEEDTLTITVDDYIFATYDENATNGADTTKKGCYVFDEGDYYFAIGDNCHDALNNVLAAKQVTGTLNDNFGATVTGNEAKVHKETLAELDNVTYATSVETGEVVCNQFDDVDINNFYTNDVVTYLTRSDWTTFPDRYDSLTATAEMIAQMTDMSYNKPSNAPAYDSFKQGADVTLKLYEMRNVPYGDARWDTFINQLTVSDMCNMVGENFGQPAVVSVGKAPNTNSDGPAGPQAGYMGAEIRGSATMRVNEVVAASTWNKELLEARGKFIAEDCLYGGTTQLWSPGCNIHRTPFSGRNFEYYSEDSVMSYICSAVQCAKMQEYGCNAAPKHFAGNDQETNRGGLCIYMTEQALRQGPLKGFEGAFTKGGALGTMMSCSRIGNVETYMCDALLTQVMRNEWGFKGITITDSVANWRANNNPTLVSFVAGTDTFNARVACGSELKSYIVQNRDGYLLQQLRLANKHFFYAMSRSNNINGLSENTDIVDFVPWWQPALIVTCSIIGLATAGCAVMFGLSRFVFNKKNGEAQE